MDTSTVKKLIDACFTAKKITELTPPLPTGIVPRHNNVIDKLHELSMQKDEVYISDISAALNVTPPSVTKLVSQLEEMGYVIKRYNGNDKRYVSLTLTDLGLSHYRTFVEAYHNDLAALFSDMRETDCLLAVDVINKLYEKMKSYTDEAK